MLPEKILNIRVFSKLISNASSVLKLSDWQIQEKFSKYPMCFMEFYERNEKQKSVEIRFDDEETSITCVFDSKERCDSAFIIPDHLNSLTDYVNLFNAIFEYDYTRCRWILSNGYLSQKQLKDTICFMINCQ